MQTLFFSGRLSSSRHAFTLIELLVVVAIVAILVGILIPGVARANQKAKTVACKSNLKQWGYALSMYADDFGRFPYEYMCDFRNLEPIRYGPLLEVNGLAPYLFTSSKNSLGRLEMTNGIYHCPGAKRPLVVFIDRIPNGYVWPPGYSPNYLGTDRLGTLALGVGGDRITNYVRGNAVAAPSDFVIMGDATHVSHLSIHFFEPLDYLTTLPSAHHSGGANMVFFDAHVEWATRTNWSRPTAEARRRWNADHEPHPETW